MCMNIHFDLYINIDQIPNCILKAGKRMKTKIAKLIYKIYDVISFQFDINYDIHIQIA